ncbi:MAG: hypothetical protein C5B48_08555 [Candidatus Rokuibacteriota bacterium]|nr:MAG: hypothetical protein C5B48_08555 [Candidatus Rokubacteria bacterium]
MGRAPAPGPRRSARARHARLPARDRDRLGQAQHARSVPRRACAAGCCQARSLCVAGPDVSRRRRPLRVRPAIPGGLGAWRSRDEVGRSEGRFAAGAAPARVPPAAAGPRRLGLRRERCDQCRPDAHDPAAQAPPPAGVRGKALRPLPHRQDAQADADRPPLSLVGSQRRAAGRVARDRRRGRQPGHGALRDSELRARALGRFSVERLEVAGRVLERGEPRRRTPLLPALAAAGGGECRRGAHDTTDQERSQSLATRLAVHDTILFVLLCALGDALLDVVVQPARALVEGDDVPARAQAGAGGQAANVAAWACALGGRARLIAKRGRDPVARLVEEELTARGVEVVGPVVDERCGIVVSQLSPHGERSMLSDRGASAALRAEELELAWLDACDALHLSGYALTARPMDEAGAKAAGAVAMRGGRVSVDLGSWTAVEAFGPQKLLARLDQLAPEVVFAGEQELKALGAEPGAPVLVVKRGARGCTIHEDGRRSDLHAVTAEVVDTTGAGDAFAAGFLLGGAELALRAASRCISKLGAMP